MFATISFWVIFICRHNKNIEYWRISLKLNHHASFYIHLSVFILCVLFHTSFLPMSMNRWKKKKELCRLKNPPWTIMPITEKHVVHIFNAKLHKLHLLKSKKQTRTHTTHSHALNLFFSVYILKPAQSPRGCVWRLILCFNIKNL